MVILLIEIFNNKSSKAKSVQTIYDEKISSKILSHSIKCPCCGSYHVIKKGSYSRNLLVFGKCEIIRIHRIKCEDCGKTHAVFSLEIIPYCYINADYALKFIKGENVDIDNKLILLEFLRNMRKRKSYLLKKYLYEFGLNVKNQSLEEIDEAILKAENKLFMQIHRGKVFKISLST